MFLAATLTGMLTATVALMVGLAQRSGATVLISMVCAALSIVPLFVYGMTYRAGSDRVPSALLALPARIEFRVPIEGYDELRVDEVLPLLQELDSEGLAAVRAHEATSHARPSILSRIDLLAATISSPCRPSRGDNVPYRGL